MSALPDFLFGTAPIRAIQQVFGLGHTIPFRILSMLGDTWGAIFVVGLAFWLFGRRPMYAVAVMVGVAAVSWTFVSQLFSVSRPEGAAIVVYEELKVGAFPSGHVSQAVAAWGLLWGVRCIPLYVPILVGLLCGLGRMYLGAHYLADVLGGLVYGFLLVALFTPVWNRVEDWFEQRSFGFYLGLVAVGLVAGLLLVSRVSVATRQIEVLGMMIAAAVALPAEYRFLHYTPGDEGGWRRTQKVLVGLAGITLLALFDRTIGAGLPIVGALSAGAAVLWVVLGAPALFRALGWVQPGGERRGA